MVEERVSLKQEVHAVEDKFTSKCIQKYGMGKTRKADLLVYPLYSVTCLDLDPNESV
jgi:hypothetical protein